MPFVHLKSTGTPTITLSFIAPINLVSMVVQLELESMAERLPDVTYSDFRNFKYLLLGCWGSRIIAMVAVSIGSVNHLRKPAN